MSPEQRAAWSLWSVRSGGTCLLAWPAQAALVRSYARLARVTGTPVVDSDVWRWANQEAHEALGGAWFAEEVAAYVRRLKGA